MLVCFSDQRVLSSNKHAEKNIIIVLPFYRLAVRLYDQKN